MGQKKRIVNKHIVSQHSKSYELEEIPTKSYDNILKNTEKENTTTTTYEVYKEESKIKGLKNNDVVNWWISKITVSFLILFSVITIVLLLAIYFIAISQFIGMSHILGITIPENPIISWLVLDTATFLFGAFIGALINKLHK